MFLARALNNVSRITSSSDRQKVLVQTLKNPEKLAKTLLRIEFLTACRRAKVSPRFIVDALKPVYKVFGDNKSVSARCKVFTESLLNESISEAFRRKAFLLRQRSRLSASIETFLEKEDFRYICRTCSQIFDITICENRPKLVRKFQKRLKEETLARTENNPSSNEQERVHNLSSLVLDEQNVSLLSKGPNFAVTQKISHRIILEAKKGVERLAYAKRWQDEKRATERRNHPNVDLNTATIIATTTDQPTASTTTTTTTTTTRPTSPGDDSAASAAPTGAAGATARRPPEADAAAVGDAAGSPAQATGTGVGKSSSNVAGLSFRFPDTDKRFPPPSTVEVECRLKQLKDDIIKTYKNHNVVESNVSKEQMDFIDKLQKNEDVVVKQSDKCKGLVLMDKTEYLNKSHVILNDKRNYEVLEKNPVPKVEAESKRIFRAVSNNKLPERTIKELTPCHSRTPVFYGLPKDHKEGVPLRPVISACGGPTEKLSCLLERILKQLLKYVQTHLWDTGDFLSKLGKYSEKEGILKNSIFFSIDVVNLYGSIPISEAIDAVCDTLRAHLQEVNTFGLTLDDIRSLLEHCLQKNVFSFNNEFYRQTLGIAMGNPCAPPIAILFLDQFERKALEGAPVRPSFIVRYIDDYAGIWTHGEQSLLDFLAYLNSLHPTLQFTLEHSGGGSGVPFLDTLVTVEEHNDVTRVETELYIKPMNSGIILHYKSAHPTSTKLNVARSQFKRAIRNSSNNLKERSSIHKIRSLLLQNGYPGKLLDRLLKEARRSHAPGKISKGKTQNHSDGFLCLPYVDEQLLCKIKSKVNKSGLNVKIAWRNNQKLRDKLIRSSLCKPKCPGGSRCHACRSGFSGDCTQKNVVYELSCQVCHEKGEDLNYIGETKRPVRLRFNEHVRDALNRSPDTPMGEHFKQAHSPLDRSSDPLRMRVLYRSKDHPDRKIAESLLIQTHRPALNSNISSWPIL